MQLSLCICLLFFSTIQIEFVGFLTDKLQPDPNQHVHLMRLSIKKTVQQTTYEDNYTPEFQKRHLFFYFLAAGV